jgi:transposase-like protein
MRQFAITYAQSAGVGLGKAADQLGVSDVTLRSWMRASKALKRVPAGGRCR